MKEPRHRTLLAEKAGYYRTRRSNTIGHIHGFGDISYCDLITQAILESPEQKLPLRRIYQWLEQNAALFTKTASTWKNSVRHNLSFYDRFVNTTCKITNIRCWSVNLLAGYGFKESRNRKKQIIPKEGSKPKRKMGRSSSLSSVSSSSSCSTLSEGSTSPLPDQTNGIKSKTKDGHQKEPSLEHYIFFKDLKDKYGHDAVEQLSYNSPQNMHSINIPISPDQPTYNNRNNAFKANSTPNSINYTNGSFVSDTSIYNLPTQNNEHDKLESNSSNFNVNIFNVKSNIGPECKSNTASNGLCHTLGKPNAVGLTLLSRPHHFSGGIILHQQTNSVEPFCQNVSENRENFSSEYLGSDQAYYLSQRNVRDVQSLSDSTSFAPNEVMPAFSKSYKFNKNDFNQETTTHLVKRSAISRNPIEALYYNMDLPSTSSGFNTINILSQINRNPQYHAGLQSYINGHHVDYNNIKYQTKVKPFTIQEDCIKNYNNPTTSNADNTCNYNMTDKFLNIQPVEILVPDFDDNISVELADNGALDVCFTNDLTFR